jgi:uncharacterized protein YebE (UPF0316 family)
MNSDLYAWVILPILVFGARVLDVTLGTMRIIYVSRGKKYLAPLLGFIEVFIWIAMVSQIVHSANNIVAYLAYAAGFAAGNFVGMNIEDRLALGTLVVRAFIQSQAAELVSHLRQAGYGVTTVDSMGSTGPVAMVYTIVPRRKLEEVLSIIHLTHPHAFLSIEDVRSTHEGIFPHDAKLSNRGLFGHKSK